MEEGSQRFTHLNLLVVLLRVVLMFSDLTISDKRLALPRAPNFTSRWYSVETWTESSRLVPFSELKIQILIVISASSQASISK